jgi:uncharacterized membrane protein YjjP (DUF1212 family)
MCRLIHRGYQPHTHLATPVLSGFHFDRILLLSKLIYRVVRKEINLEDALVLVDKIECSKPRYGVALVFFAWVVLNPIAIAFFFRGGLHEMVVMVTVASLSWFISCIPQAREACPAISAFLAIVISYLYHMHVHDINVLTAALGGIISFGMCTDVS